MCLFCKIVQGEIPNHTIYEDANYLAFLDISPKDKGHTLVIPKKHYDLVWDIPEEEIGEFFKICKKIANHFQEISGNKYVYSIIHGEGVPHAHIHIIPSESQTFGAKISKFLEESDAPEFDQEKAKEIVKKYKLRF